MPTLLEKLETPWRRPTKEETFRTNQGADCGENAPENMSAGEYQRRRLDPSDPEE